MPYEAFPGLHAPHPVCYGVLWQTSDNRRLFYCVMQISQHFLRFVQNQKLLFLRPYKFLIISNAVFAKIYGSYFKIQAIYFKTQGTYFRKSPL